MPQRADQFIVDNSDEHWKALEYLRQWCEISESIDIATGHFEIGALLALDGEWQKVSKLRLLIGGETSRVTADAIAAALDSSITVERAEEDPFLTGIAAIVDAIRTGKIEIRTYRPRKFHAKAYITHGKLDIVGSAALVGSSNFTRPGLSQNVELNVRFSGPEVRELQSWFEVHWADAEPVTPELLKVLEHHARTFTPFEVYVKALQAVTRDVESTDVDWERAHSRIYPLLAPYQQEAYHGLRRMAKRWNGGFLTDGVGLGKTFVGLMLTEYFAVKQRKNVLIMATKTGADAVWRPELGRRLPGLSGTFTNVEVMAHTDLSRADGLETIDHLRERVDVVIVDEAHNFRNHGPQSEDADTPRSRWWRMQRLCEGKTVFLLTATPINNTLFDLVHEAELFTGLDDDYFAAVGVASIKRYVAELERPFRELAKAHGVVGGNLDLTDFDELMHRDALLESIIWQNSRKYAVESSKVASGGQVVFPEQRPPQVVPYSLGLLYGRLLDELEAAFGKQSPLFVLPMYYPLAFSRRDDVDTIAENRQRQVVGLIRTTFLKRFESSVAAFAGSCLDLAAKILLWLDANSHEGSTNWTRLRNWHDRNGDLLADVHARYRSGQEMAAVLSEDMTEQELEELELHLDPDEYDINAMVDAAFEDLVQLGRFLERIADAAGVDDKYARLLQLLTDAPGSRKLPKDIFTPEFRTQKVLVFTEYADTARYLHERLRKDGVEHVDRLDGSRSSDRVRMIRRFAPHYNKVKADEREALDPLRVLVSTDVLSEGVNLQDASLIVNYDVHWNPVRLMQRIGRVDRRLDPDVESELVKANPRARASRGVVQVRNFLPPDDIETLLRLYQRVEARVLLISKTLGIPGGKLLTADDVLDDVKVLQAFREEYEGDLSPIEQLRLHYQSLIAADPSLPQRIDALPEGISSAESGGQAGLFLCRRVPTLLREEDGDAPARWSLEPGRVEWVFTTVDGERRTDVAGIDAIVGCGPDAPHAGFGDRSALRTRLRGLEREETKRYRKSVQLPLDAPTPRTICWMETR